MDKNIIKSVFKEYIHPIDVKVVSKMVDYLKVDKYVKKLDSLAFTKLFIYAQLKQIPSLTDISLKLKRKKRLQKEIGLKSISKSQLSRKLGDIPPDIFQAIMHHLVQKIHQEFGPQKADDLLGKIHLIDSSTISFCLSQYRWADFRNTKAGVKLHTRVVICEDIPFLDEMIVTPARPADATQLDALIVVEKNALHVFDRGYFDFEKFDQYCEKGIRFVTRIKENTIVKVIEEVPVDPSSSIIREAVVKLGKMKHPLRLVETMDSEGNKIEIVMNDAKVSAEEISHLYRSRWQIELFFKWMKQHLVLKKCYGKSSNAVYNQIYIAMITFCLTLLMKRKLNYQGTLLDIHKSLGDCWSYRFPEFIKELFKEPERKSSGRRRCKHEKVYTDTLKLYEEGDNDYLNDLTYDPLYM